MGGKRESHTSTGTEGKKLVKQILSFKEVPLDAPITRIRF